MEAFDKAIDGIREARRIAVGHYDADLLTKLIECEAQITLLKLRIKKENKK